MSNSDFQLTRIANCLEWFMARQSKLDEDEESRKEQEKADILEMQQTMVQQVHEAALDAQRKAFTEHEQKHHQSPLLHKKKEEVLA